MSGAALKREDISSQVIHISENTPNPCHIRDSEYRYVYINPAMRDFLDLPDSFNILGQRLSEISHWSSPSEYRPVQLHLVRSENGIQESLGSSETE